MCRLFSLLLVLYSPSIWAFELVFAYGAGNGAPFSIIKDGQLTSGLFKDIGESLASELGVSVQFRHAPHKRTSLLLADGTVNSVCMTHPDWIEGSEYLFWSDKAMEDYDHLITLPKKGPVQNFKAAHGMTIGAMTGYIYFPELTNLFVREQAVRKDMNSLEALYASLFADRIDAVVDSLISVRYRQKTRPEYKSLNISKMPVYRYDLYCAFNPSLKPHSKKINDAIKRMIARDEFNTILKSYQ